MNTEEPGDAPRVDVPTIPAPVDCMPSLVAAGRIAPVVKVSYYGGTAWDVCDMSLARTALTDRRLSKDVELTPHWMRIPGVMLGAQPSAKVARTMVMSEGPEHARIRRLHAQVFTPRNTADWAARLAEELLAGLAAEGCTEVNLVERSRYPLPLVAICDMLGLQPQMYGDMRRIIDGIIYSPDQRVRTSSVGALASAVAGWASDPSTLKGGLITSLLAGVDGDAAITANEVVTWTVGLVMAGYETMADLIASAILEALRKPSGQRPRSEAEVEEWIEETPRVHPPFPHVTWRFATEDLDLGGYLIPRGAPVQINVAAASRRPHSEPANHFDPAEPRDHISFGLGRHYCLGAPLARLEAKIALSAFLSRFPNARLSETTDVERESEWLTRRISVLPVVLAGAGSPGIGRGRCGDDD